jgi:ATP-binding cassette subfamily B protein
MRKISGFSEMFANGFAGLNRFVAIMRTEPTIQDKENAAELTDVKGEITVDKVSFAYDGNLDVLHEVSVHVNPGETIAIVGESGSGKSTILNLVIGFNLAQEGQVLIDGQDIKEIDLHSYRKHIAIVPQNSVLFTGTIRENITYGIKNVTDELIARALEAARLTSFINTLPRGVDTMLEEHGANLSGGQRQRLSIARAIIRDPDVIILDEATSALDSISEKEIQHAINNLTKNRTTFIVAHRLSTIRDADRIAVIKGGMCVEIGSYEELMAAQGEFYRMQTAQ